MVSEAWVAQYESMFERYDADFSKHVGASIDAQYNYLTTPHEDKEGYFWDGNDDDWLEKYMVYKMCDLYQSDELTSLQRAKLFLVMKRDRNFVRKHIDYLLWWARGIGEISNESVPWQLLILSVFGNDSLDQNLVNIAEWNWD